MPVWRVRFGPTSSGAAATAALVLTLSACGGGPRVPDWQMSAKQSLERAQAAYLSGKDQVEKTEFARARDQIGSSR